MIKRVGPALFGTPNYRQALARALGVNERTLRRWLADGEAPEHALRSMYELLRLRRAEIDAVQYEIMRELRL